MRSYQSRNQLIWGASQQGWTDHGKWGDGLVMIAQTRDTISAFAESLLVQCECLWLGSGIAVVIIGIDDRDCCPLCMLSAFLTCKLLILPTYMTSFAVSQLAVWLLLHLLHGWCFYCQFAIRFIRTCPILPPFKLTSAAIWLNPTFTCKTVFHDSESLLPFFFFFCWRHSHSRYDPCLDGKIGWMSFWMMR